MDVYTAGDLRPGAVGRRADDVDEAIALINANPYGNGTAIFTSSVRPRAGSSAGHVGMIGINVPVPCRWPSTPSAAGRTRSSATSTSTVPRASSFYTRAKVVTAAGRAVAGQRGQLHFPRRASAEPHVRQAARAADRRPRRGATSTPEQSGVPLKDVRPFAKSLGGTATNVAVGAARLGHRSAVLTKVGPGRLRRLRPRGAAGFGVDASYVGTAAGCRRRSSSASSTRPRTRRCVLPRPIAPDLTLTADDVPWDLVATSRCSG
jgi:hypothetical protein